MKKIGALFLIIISSIIYGQETDTLSFYSNVFGEKRTVYVHKPEFYKYTSDSVKLPVIYVLDGQHEWFVKPVLSDIQYLQYTHEIPNAIIVIIPHVDRNEECEIEDINSAIPLDIFLTKELEKELIHYRPNDFRVLIGHSFSASFSLYSFYNHPNFYSSVIANTPADQMEALIKGFQANVEIDKTKISISIGGQSESKDYYHRRKYDQLKEKYPKFFNSINKFEANNSAHNAVPIASVPHFLTKIFEKFSFRYSSIAKVNDEYKVENVPDSPEMEMNKILIKSKLGQHFYPPELAEINGIASRYWNSDFKEICTEIYKLGITLYPYYFEFYLSLYELTLSKNKLKAKQYLEKAESLLITIESDWEGKGEIMEDIKSEKKKNGW